MKLLIFISTTIIILLPAGAIVPVSEGTITGKVTVDGQPIGSKTVVFIDRIQDREFSPPEEPVEMDQKSLEFVPRVLPVLKGTTVRFLNSDDVLHNVFTIAQCATRFDLGTWPRGEVRYYTFEDAFCEAVLLCNTHPEMEAYVIVIPTPYFSVTDGNGQYEISNIPPGTYTLKLWNERMEVIEKQVEVSENEIVVVNFRF